ncbi:ATP-binding protein [Chryseobacterium sp. A301]
MPIRLDRSLYLLRLIFVVATALIFFLMGLTYKHMDQIGQTNSQVNRSFDISLKLEELLSSVNSMEVDRRNYILTGQEQYKRSFSLNEDRIRKYTQRIAVLTYENEHQFTNLVDLRSLIFLNLNRLKETLNHNEQNDASTKLSDVLEEGNYMRSQIVEQIEKMQVLEHKHLGELREELLFSQKSTPIYLYIISLFSLGLLAFAFFRINKDFKNQKLINQELQLSIDTLELAETVGNNGIWTLDLFSGALKFSTNFFKLLGLPESSRPGLDLFIGQLHPEDQSFVEEKIEGLKSGKEVDSFRYRVVNPDGQQRQFQSLGRIVRTGNNQLILLVMTTDVTREIEDQLKLEGINYVLTERNKNLSVANETYLEAEKIGYFGTWQFFYDEKEFVFSQNLVRLFGVEPDTFSQQIKHLLPYVYTEDRELISQVIQKIYEGDEFEPFVSRIMPKDHPQMRYLSTTGKRISNPFTGDYLLVITQDITEEFLIKLDLEQNNVVLEANNSELQAFNYAASHDLQEPLRKIETFLSRLRDTNYENLTENGKQYMDRTLVAANRMRSLIDDLLHFSRSTRSEASFEFTDLNVLLQNAQEELAHLVEEKKAVITTEHLPTLDVIPFQIQQMFVNLIGNSLKYSSENRKPLIEITCTKTSSALEPVIRNEVKTNYFKLVFKDNGIGFENQYSEKIFTLFNRLHSREDYRGTGIGLAICKKVIENHNGYIYAQGEPGEGSIFTILLPEQV